MKKEPQIGTSLSVIEALGLHPLRGFNKMFVAGGRLELPTSGV